MKTRKIAIIGTGHVGSHVAFALATQGEADELVLIDTDKAKAAAQAFDVMDSVSYLPHHVIAYQGDYSDIADADIVVVSAGPLPDAEEQSRLDTLEDTIEVLADILPQLKASGFSGIIVNISNPADVVATFIQKYLEYPSEKIISTGCVLDSARLQAQLSEILSVHRDSLQAYCFGEHGFSAMIPWSHCLVGGLPILAYASEEQKEQLDFEEILANVKDRGYVVLRGKGSTEFGIASALVEVVRAIFHDEHKVLPISTLLQGEYGQTDVFASVPTVLGKDGVERVLVWSLTETEQTALADSCQVIEDNFKKALGYAEKFFK